MLISTSISLTKRAKCDRKKRRSNLTLFYMDIPLCRGTGRIRGLFGFLSLFFVVLFGLFEGISSPVLASGMSIDDNPLEFQASVSDSGEGEDASSPVCEAETAPKEGESEKDFRFRMLLTDMLRNEPIEKMIPFIVKRDRETAAFLVSIARKESSWGEHVPSKDGIDCFNYWGFKGQGSRGVGMGHACFGSPEEAVETVGNRLAQLIHEKKLNSPERLIVWKCGSSCAAHSPESVAKWISDVRFIYTKIFMKG